MASEYYESYNLAEGELLCDSCGVPLENGEIVLHYLGNNFPILMPRCPRCGLGFIPEELVIGKIYQVEQALEDK